MSNSNRNSQDQNKREKGLAMMGMMSGMPDDLVLSGTPETAPRQEKRENAFLRFMSSPVAAVILSVCVAFAVVIAIVRAGTNTPAVPNGTDGAGHVAGQPTLPVHPLDHEGDDHAERNVDISDRVRSMDVDGIRFVLNGIKDAYALNETISLTAYLVNIGEPFTYRGRSFDFRPDIEISGNGMEKCIGAGVDIDRGETVKTHTVKTGQKTDVLNSINISGDGMNGAGTYTVTLTYNGKKAVFEDVLVITGEHITEPVPEFPRINTVTKDVDGIEFVISDIKEAYSVGETISFIAYLINLGEPFTYTGLSIDFRPGVLISGNGMENALQFGHDIDIDEEIATHTVTTGQESSFQYPIQAPAALLNGEGGYTITLTYGDRVAVFENAFFVANDPKTETIPPEVGHEPETIRPDDTTLPFAGDEPPVDWVDMHYTGDAYAYACPTGRAFCLRVDWECIPGDPTQRCFRTDYPLQVNVNEDWTVIGDRDELRKVLENYKNMEPNAPGYADMKKTVKELETVYDPAFFQTHDILLLRFETTSGSARYTVTYVSVEEEAIDGSGRAVTLGGYDVNRDADRTTDMAGFVMLIPLDKGINIGGVYTMIKHPD